VQITSWPTAPSITSQPQTQSTTVGSNVTFSLTASGTTPLAYQWQFNAGDIPGATTTSLQLTNVQSADAGTDQEMPAPQFYGSALQTAVQQGQVSKAESKIFGVVKPDEEHLLWPYQGEYWRDELGFYRQVVASACGR